MRLFNSIGCTLHGRGYEHTLISHGEIIGIWKRGESNRSLSQKAACVRRGLFRSHKCPYSVLNLPVIVTKTLETTLIVRC